MVVAPDQESESVMACNTPDASVSIYSRCAMPLFHETCDKRVVVTVKVEGLHKMPLPPKPLVDHHVGECIYTYIKKKKKKKKHHTERPICKFPNSKKLLGV